MIFDRVADIEIANKVLNDLAKIPSKVLKITNEFGIKVYCFDRNFKPSWIGLIDKNSVFEDGRSADETSFYFEKLKSIIVYRHDLEEEKEEIAFSTVLHEFGHALDHALANKLGSNNYLSNIDSKIYTGWQSNKALDCYAGINPREYFAQAFMAFFQTGKENYKPPSYREHTREELKLRDNDMFCYLQSLLF